MDERPSAQVAYEAVATGTDPMKTFVVKCVVGTITDLYGPLRREASVAAMTTSAPEVGVQIATTAVGEVGHDRRTVVTDDIGVVVPRDRIPMTRPACHFHGGISETFLMYKLSCLIKLTGKSIQPIGNDCRLKQALEHLLAT